MPAHHHYRQKWIEAGYKSDMGSAIACCPPGSRDLIRVYHLTSAEHGISNIALGRLKVARFSDLNDPFELLGMNLRESNMRNALRGFKKSYGEHTGLLCFSEDWAEPVMWSHYASKHRGICLGFDISRDCLQKVAYQDDRIRAGLGDTPSPTELEPELQSHLLCTKSRGWSYEVEQRMLVPLELATTEGPLHFSSFAPHMLLTEVILGPLCNLPLLEIRRLVTSLYPAAVTYQSRLAFKSFKVVPDERTVP